MIATLNCKGLGEITKREQVVKLMYDNYVGSLVLQETNVNSNSSDARKHETEQCLFLYATGVSNNDKEAAEKRRAEGGRKGNGKGKGNKGEGKGYGGKGEQKGQGKYGGFKGGYGKANWGWQGKGKGTYGVEEHAEEYDEIRWLCPISNKENEEHKDEWMNPKKTVKPDKSWIKEENKVETRNRFERIAEKPMSVQMLGDVMKIRSDSKIIRTKRVGFMTPLTKEVDEDEIEFNAEVPKVNDAENLDIPEVPAESSAKDNRSPKKKWLSSAFMSKKSCERNVRDIMAKDERKCTWKVREGNWTKRLTQVL